MGVSWHGQKVLIMRMGADLQLVAGGNLNKLGVVLLLLLFSHVCRCCLSSECFQI